jgi:enoyl-CoA hydratase/carnithine racemase
MSEVDVVHHDHWAEIVLNRPEVRNAINGPLGEALAAAFRDAQADDDIRVVLLRGAGGAFCSGLDLKSFNAEPAPDWIARFPQIWREAHKSIYEFEKPMVVALERYAINGGAALALAGDLLLAGETAYLQVGEVQQGMAAPYNMAWLRLRHSEAVTARLTLIGDKVAGPQLEQLGIAHSVVTDDGVAENAGQLVARLAEYPADSLSRIKATLRGYNSTPADTWFDYATKATPDRGRRAPQRAR